MAQLHLSWCAPAFCAGRLFCPLPASQKRPELVGARLRRAVFNVVGKMSFMRLMSDFRQLFIDFIADGWGGKAFF